MSPPTSTLPLVDFQRELMLESESILQHHSRKVYIRAMVEVLVQWKGAGLDDSTWELTLLKVL